ncbi:E3 ubiquitin-protein ligase TRIM33 isoform X3 [Girardinichthys multiradiatus]|uniref:E3 ubiquitin-protein ligase TRIM33 isoform X3 n=1 Tax=Girardinichthys multiradiatus TaxID=208333 RepID=UPI001FADD55C|nr:E3 ubiquitin-protein ligase TRIM33 isoform X3 [Girardinichthys multiradiatus]
MADNKGEEDMEPSANVDSMPSVQAEEQSNRKSDDQVIVVEANSKENIETESSNDANEEPNGNSEGVDDSSGGTTEATAAAVVVAAGEADGGVSNAASPTETSSANPEPSANETVPAADATVSGNTTETSPAPAASVATPVSTPINLLDTCTVCKQSLQTRDCEPKLLPCLHSFCLKCIPQPDRQISVQVPGPHGQTDTHIVNVMRCSVCHQDYKQSDIIDNYFVKDTTEATSTSDEKAAQVCTSCEDNAGTVGFCVECGEWLCKTCVEAHQRVKITKDHKIRTKEDADASSESVNMTGQRPVFCPNHKQEPLKLFCETCDTLTCRDCQLLEHKEHRYQFLEEAFQNHKGIIEANMAKLQEKKNYVHYSVSQLQNRLKELGETHRKVEHEIKIAVFTLINEINKKGKALLQQLESVNKERSMRLMAQHKDTAQLAQQIHHVLNFCNWAITSGSSTALLYSKRPIMYQLRQLFKARLEPAPQSNGVVRFFCDPTFWAKNVVNLGNLVIEKPPPSAQPPGMMVGGPAISPGQGHPSKHSGQINLAQLRLQHMQQAAYAQQKHQQHQQQQQQQQQQQIQQQMRIASQMSQQHARPGGPAMVQQQPPRLISMQQLQRAGTINGGPNAPMYASSHHMRLAGPPQGRMPAAQPRHNGQQYAPLMQPQLQRQHSNPGHAGPFPVASLHNASPTSPTSASMAGAHAHRGPASPIIGPIELIPSVTNPENLPCLPEIPPIQLEDAGSSNLGHLLSRYISASQQHQLGSTDMNPSPGLSTLSPGSSGLSNAHTPARPSSTSSTGSRGSCSSAGRTGTGGGATGEQVKVKKEPGTEDDYSGPSSVKTERGKDAGRSACMLSSPENSPLGVTSVGPDSLRGLGERIKTEPTSETCCPGLNGSSSLSTNTTTSTTLTSTTSQTGPPLTNGNVDKRSGTNDAAQGSGGKDDDPNEDWCAVCINGGDLLCCDRCPKVFHMKCHVPTIKIFPQGDFLCTFCRSIATPEIEYCDESKGIKGDQSLNPEDQRKCERLLLYIFCHELSMGFREPVASSVPNYYKIIKQPMDLKKVKKKLQLRSSQYYKSIQEFVDDMRLIFKNCAKYNEMSRIIRVYDEEKEINTQAGSEMAISGKAVSLYFEEKLQEMFPDQNFPDSPDPESSDEKEREDVDTEDSEEDFIQPRRKRLKTDEKVVHIK